MTPVRWGVISTAKIGLEKVIPGMQKSPMIEIAAIASRDAGKAAAAAKSLGIPKSYGSYEALLADPAVEAIYNPLPNEQHVPLTLAAAKAGKHVLCEKPMSMNADELAALNPFAAKVLIGEAFMVRHHPLWQQVKARIDGGELGTVRAIQVAFAYHLTDPANIRNKPENGGGGLYDIGCYAIVTGRYFFGAEPLRGIALFDRDPAFGTDRVASALLDFGNGRQLAFTTSTQTHPYQRTQILGTKARAEILIPFNQPLDVPCRYRIDAGRALDGSDAVEHVVPVADQYQLQGEHFSRAVRGEIPLAYGLDDARRNMTIIDALFRSEQSGRLEPIG